MHQLKPSYGQLGIYDNQFNSNPAQTLETGKNYMF